MPRQGFLGTSAPLSADITLAIEIAMALALVIGMVLARRHRYRAHAWCQSTVVVLNLIVIAKVMVPAFRSQVTPEIPARLARTYYALAAGHATMGCIAKLLGVYTILVAGTRILPERLRFVRYKPWMRTALLIWWLVLLLGVTTYVRWYIAPKPIAPQSPSFRGYTWTNDGHLPLFWRKWGLVSVQRRSEPVRLAVAIGTIIADAPYRSVRAQLTRTARTWDEWRRSMGMHNARTGIVYGLAPN